MTLFDLIPNAILLLSDVFSAFKNGRLDAVEQLDAVIAPLQKAIHAEQDTALAAIHLVKSQSPLKQSIDGAILATLAAERLGYSTERTHTLIQATLTANFSFLDMQVLLNINANKLSDEQFQKIQQHPILSAELLEKNGVSNQHWLDIVLQHHERLDGKGYPKQLSQEQVLQEAMIIGLCEFYTSMIEERSYREPKLPKDVLQMIHKQDNERPAQLNQTFIRLLGIYPPGTFVQLANKEVAIVTERIPNQVTPKIKALFDPNQKPYLGALERDANQDQFKIVKPCQLPGQPSVDLFSIWAQ